VLHGGISLSPHSPEAHESITLDGGGGFVNTKITYSFPAVHNMLIINGLAFSWCFTNRLKTGRVWGGFRRQNPTTPCRSASVQVQELAPEHRGTNEHLFSEFCVVTHCVQNSVSSSPGIVCCFLTTPQRYHIHLSIVKRPSGARTCT